MFTLSINNQYVKGLLNPQAKKQKRQISVATCPKCSQIPFLNLFEDKPGKIRIKCPFCSNDEIMPISDYLDTIVKNYTSKPKCEKNEKHFNKRGIGHCVQCRKWFCKECLAYHKKYAKEHKITKVITYFMEKCLKHSDRKLDYFCISCKEHYCAICIDKHRRHNYVRLTDIFTRKDADQIVAEMKNVIDETTANSERTREAFVAKLNFLIAKKKEKKKLEKEARKKERKEKKEKEKKEKKERKEQKEKNAEEQKENLEKDTNAETDKEKENNSNSDKDKKDSSKEIDKVSTSEMEKENKIKKSKKSSKKTVISEVDNEAPENNKEKNEKEKEKDEESKLIKKLEKLMPKLDEALEINKENNELVVEVINTLMHNFGLCEFNYYNIVNLLANSAFVIKGFDFEEYETLTPEKIKEAIHFFKKTSILTKNTDPEHIILKLTIQPHKSFVKTILLLKDGRLASCSNDNTINIYNSSSFELLFTIENIHQDYVYNMTQLENGYIVTDGYENGIKIWEIGENSGRLVVTKESHKYPVINVVTITGNRFVSSGMDSCIKIWDGSEPFNEIISLTQQKGEITPMIQLKDQDILVSGSKDCTIYFWNLITYQPIRCVKGIKCLRRNCMVEIKKNHKILIGEIKLIFVVDTISYEIETVIMNEFLGEIQSFLILDNGSVLVGSSREKCGIFYHIDPYNYKPIYKMEKIHEGIVSTMLMLKKRYYVTCSEDCTIKVWKINY